GPVNAGRYPVREATDVDPEETIMVVKEVRKAVGGATDKLSATGAQDLAKSLMQGQGKEQVTKAAQEILKWSTRNRERLTEFVRAEVSSQLKSMGVATRADLDALRKRVRELEREGGKTGAKRTAAKRSSAKSTKTAGTGQA
ncbi:MAG TPA: phasin family protein, partial [Actinomycetota bacterium]|nr:phasin family protein [Actinomycetota bacterium]